MNYNTLREFADSYVLGAMGVFYLVCCAWALRPKARARNEEAANLIFKDNQFKDRDHG